MTTAKQVWLASGAILLGLSGARAADLPFRKAAPVDYVRVCDIAGATSFFYIPGTDTCLRVTGQVRAEYTFRPAAPTGNASQFAYNQAGQSYPRDLTSFRARGYLNADTRTQTAYGALRAFVSIRITNDTTSPGPVGGRGAFGVGGVPAGVRASTGLFQGLAGGSQTTVDKAFIQFAGISAGRTQSFFDFDAQSYELLTNTVANSNQVTELLAYTATFGGGFSGTVSIENATERRIGDNGSFVFDPTNGVTAAGASSFNNPTVGNGRASVLAYGGQDLPDIVANIRYDAEWGSAQVSGAYHQIRSLPVNIYGAAPTPASVALATVSPSADGFAVLGGVKVLLPSLAKGDSLTLQGSYEDGAMDYVNPVNYTPVGLSNVYDDSKTGVASVYGIPLNDAFILPNGKIGKNSAVGAYGAFRHYFIPEVYGTIYGAYLDITNPIQAERLGSGTDSARIFQVGANLVWTPAKDFQIGAEGLYSNVRFKSEATGLYFGAGAPGPLGVSGGTTPQNPDDFRTRLSLRRAF